MSLAAKPLIIAEKPSAARAVAEALGGFKKAEGYMESDEYRLSWAIGHLVELKGPEEYDPALKRWSLATLPILPERFELTVSAKTRTQFNLLARLIKAAPLVVNACDAGREGELIFRYIYTLSGGRAPVQRLWTSALTREAIRHAWKEMKSGREYDRLYQSALCRSQGDWLVGMNATRAFTAKWGELLSVGRVQTPTLSLLVRREEEIERFRPETYWEVAARFRTKEGALYEGRWIGPDGDRLPSAEAAEAIRRKVHGQSGIVHSMETKEEAERPPLLYDLTTLQREANKRFGLTAAATLKAAQSLYEGKHITYPRTDSRFITADLLKAFPKVLGALGLDPLYRGFAASANLSLVGPGNRRVVDASKVSDHHAILPTAEVPKGISGAEAKIYDLIARRFLSQFYPEARWAIAEAMTMVEGEPFRSRGKQLLQPGWRQVEGIPAKAEGGRGKAKGDAEPDGPPLPNIKAGERVAVADVKSEQKETQAPKRFTEAALLGAMENAGKEMDDQALKAAMKGHGLGTPATRAAIIERLKAVGYMEAKQKSLQPTAKGRRLFALAEAAQAEALLSAELTGEWEKRIADIQAGSYPPDKLMAEIRQLAVGIVAGVKGASTPANLPGGAGGAASSASDGEEGGDAAPAGRTARGRRAPDDAGLTGDPSIPAGSCPSCGRPVLRQGRDWRCSGECEVRIPAWLCGKVIDREQAELLLTKRKTKLITGFVSPRTGKSFKAFLVLQEGKVGFEFPPDKPKGTGAKKGGVKSGAKRTATAKAGSRAAGTGRAPAGGNRGVGRRASGTSEPAGGGA
ncbi:MAG TPA: DNA topoisomerase 3 [Symbiobacteriaceae bacterium]|nr:DNA topoisomerase 3 [Symbiobacteriaceae bacterium]